MRSCITLIEFGRWAQICLFPHKTGTEQKSKAEGQRNESGPDLFVGEKFCDERTTVEIVGDGHPKPEVEHIWETLQQLFEDALPKT